MLRKLPAEDSWGKTPRSICSSRAPYLVFDASNATAERTSKCTPPALKRGTARLLWTPHVLYAHCIYECSAERKSSRALATGNLQFMERIRQASAELDSVFTSLAQDVPTRTARCRNATAILAISFFARRIHIGIPRSRPLVCIGSLTKKRATTACFKVKRWCDASSTAPLRRHLSAQLYTLESDDTTREIVAVLLSLETNVTFHAGFLEMRQYWSVSLSNNYKKYVRR